MQGAFGTVIVFVVVVGVVGAIAALLVSGRTWRELGKNSLVLDRDLPRSSSATVHERDAEIREMLQARNARRLRRGEAQIARRLRRRHQA